MHFDMSVYFPIFRLRFPPGIWIDPLYMSHDV